LLTWLNKVLSLSTDCVDAASHLVKSWYVRDWFRKKQAAWKTVVTHHRHSYRFATSS